VGDIEASELTAAQLQERVAKANRSLEAVMRWLIECHGVKPLDMLENGRLSVARRRLDPRTRSRTCFAATPE